jgi:hypothetical protein
MGKRRQASLSGSPARRVGGGGAPSVSRLLVGTGIGRRRIAKNAAGEVFSIALPGPPETDGWIAVTAHSVELAVRVPLPEGWELTGAQPSTDRVLQVLGALNLGVQSHGLRVSPLAHIRGLEGFVITRHLCRDLLSAERLREELLALQLTTRRVFEALSEPAARLLAAVRKAAGVRHAAPARQERRGTPEMIPTFDPAAMEQMAERRRHRRRRGR